MDRGDIDQRMRLGHIVDGRPDTLINQSLQLTEHFRSLSAEECEELVQPVSANDRTQHSPVFVVDLVDGQLPHPRGYGESHPAGCAVLARKGADPSGETRPEDDGTAQMALPADVWQEVFTHLDTVTQTKLRAVCKTWNWLLKLSALRSTIVIRGDVGRFLGTATVQKCLSPGAKRVVLTEWMLIGEAESVLQALCAVAEQTNVRLHAVLLHRVTLDGLQGYNGVAGLECDQVRTLQDSISGWRRLPCDTIHILHGILTCNFSAWKYPRPTASTRVEMAVPCIRLLPSADIVGCLLDAVECGLPVTDERKLHNLLQYLNGVGRSKKKVMMRRFASQVLCALQSEDPRPSAHYPEKRWCEDGLHDVQLEKLSRITRHCLAELRLWTSRKGW